MYIKLVRKPDAPKSMRKTVYIKAWGNVDKHGIGTIVWTSVNALNKTCGGITRTTTLKNYYNEVKQ